MRFFLCVCCVAIVGELTPAGAQSTTASEAPLPVAELTVGQSRTWLPPTRVGRISLVSGNVDLRRSDEPSWSDAERNQPVFAGYAVRTDPRTRAEIQIGATTIYLSNATEIGLADVREAFAQITLSGGRIGLDLRHLEDGETVEVDLPQGAVWLLSPGSYDIDAGADDVASRVAVFEGTARVATAGTDARIATGQMVLIGGPDAAAVGIERAAADTFAGWCREHDYDTSRLAASYYLSPHMTGFAELDAAGIWKINSDYGPVWFPADLEWSPYRFGHWNWIAPWGWTWIDDQPWGFAPSHYGRWIIINEHWAWVPGNFVERPLYAPAVVAFLGTPGVGLSSEEGPTVAWFPLAPNEVYWPSYTRDVNYVRRLNHGDVANADAIGLRADGEPPLELFNEDFANRGLATVIPRSAFINARSAGPARLTLPLQRLQNAPVLMASPQIGPPVAQRTQTANKPAMAAPDRLVLRVARNKGGKQVRAAAMQPRGRVQPALVIRGAHLRAPSYAGSPGGRQVVLLRLAHSGGGAGRGVKR
jgi:hypothetical protein